MAGWTGQRLSGLMADKTFKNPSTSSSNKPTSFVERRVHNKQLWPRDAVMFTNTHYIVL